MGKTYFGTGRLELIESADTVQVCTGRSTVERIIVIAGTVSIYDHASEESNLRLKNVDQCIDVGGRFQNGIRAVTSGADVNIVIIYNEG